MKLRDRVKNLNTNKIGIVFDVQRYYGYCRVRYDDGSIVRYQMEQVNEKNIAVLTPEQYADHLLSKENNGITDSWLEC